MHSRPNLAHATTTGTISSNSTFVCLIISDKHRSVTLIRKTKFSAFLKLCGSKCGIFPVLCAQPPAVSGLCLHFLSFPSPLPSSFEAFNPIKDFLFFLESLVDLKEQQPMADAQALGPFLPVICGGHSRPVPSMHFSSPISGDVFIASACLGNATSAKIMI